VSTPDFPRTAIVTGSDSGIGRATAVALAAAGCDVGITWHTDHDGAQATEKEVEDLGRTAHVRQLDLTGCRRPPRSSTSSPTRSVAWTSW
jgi:NAD(P)-dependent dehydrogenase (short-subunit alcohol dehydrogenase family)